MEIFQVGGSVRDKLMDRDSQDLDWVVVGARPEELLALGFTPVGADFPVFLHPQTLDEYALARTERKSGAGYLGFEVEVENVTLEEDLMRRDLTINAMALTKDGSLIDPYGGQADLANKVIRHVGPAFAEDPVRILRVLRFLARFGPAWTVAPETQALMTKMVLDGEASALVSERIWKETSRALMEDYPQRFVQGLAQYGLVGLPCFRPYRFGWHCATALAGAPKRKLTLNARAALAFGHEDQSEDRPAGVPVDTWKAVLAWTRFGSDERLLAPAAHAEHVVAFLERIDAFKSPELLADLLSCWECVGQDVTMLASASKRALLVDTKSITASLPAGPAVGQAIRTARVAAI